MTVSSPRRHARPVQWIRRRWVVGPVVAAVFAAMVMPAFLRLVERPGASAASGLASQYFGFMLSAAAIVFAVSFADQRHWPSIREIAKFCHLGEWLGLGAAATIVGWYGEVLDQPALSSAAAVLWLLVALVGTYCLYLIIKYSNADTMTRRMAEALVKNICHGDVPASFHRAVSESLARQDAVRIRDLTEQVREVMVRCPDQPAAFELTVDFVRRVVSVAARGGLDGGTAAEVIEKCLPAYDARWPDDARRDEFITAHFLRIARVLSDVHGIIAHAADRGDPDDLAALRDATIGVAKRLEVLFDPSPKFSEFPESAVTLDVDPLTAVACYRALSVCADPGGGGVGIYALFEHVTGRRFGGNFYQGLPILADTVVGAHSDREAIRVAVESAVAEQLMVLPHSIDPNSRPCYVAASPSAVAATAMIRIAASLGPFPDAAESLSSWSVLVAQLAGQGVPPVPDVDPLPVPIQAVGLAVSHALRLQTAAQDSMAHFLEMLPHGLGAAATTRMSEIVGGDPADTWEISRRILAVPEELSYGW